MIPVSEDLGPRVEDDYGLWLTWKEPVADGWLLEWKQRPLTRWEALLWRLFGKVPAP